MDPDTGQFVLVKVFVRRTLSQPGPAPLTAVVAGAVLGVRPGSLTGPGPPGPTGGLLLSSSPHILISGLGSVVTNEAGYHQGQHTAQHYQDHFHGTLQLLGDFCPQITEILLYGGFMFRRSGREGRQVALLLLRVMVGSSGLHQVVMESDISH